MSSFVVACALSIVAVVMFVMGLFNVYDAPLIPMAVGVLMIASIFMNLALLL